MGFRLLEWLDELPDHNVYQDITPFIAAEGLTAESAHGLARHLQARGFIHIATGLDNRPDSRITPEGVAHLHQIRTHRLDPSLRARTARRLMLCWLAAYQQTHDTAYPDWGGFLEDPASHVLADPLSVQEVAREAGYLQGKGLILSTHIEEAPEGTVRPWLTTEGYECAVDYGGDVSEYLNRRSGRVTNQTWIGSNSGNVAVGSSSFTQNASSGPDVGKLVEFVTTIRQALPVLGLTGDQQSAVEAALMELDAAATTDPQPDKGRLRRLVDAIITGVTNAGTPLATTLATSLGDEAIRAITGH